MTSLSEAILDWVGAIGVSLSGAPTLPSPAQPVRASRTRTQRMRDRGRFAMDSHMCAAAARIEASAEARCAGRAGAAAAGGSDGLGLHRQQALALQSLARKLAGAADRFRLFPCLSFRGVFVVGAELHLAANTLGLHLLFQRLEGLVNVVVANENLHACSFVCALSQCARNGIGGAGSKRPRHLGALSTRMADESPLVRVVWRAQSTKRRVTCPILRP